jgi:hypothetical protein
VTAEEIRIAQAHFWTAAMTASEANLPAVMLDRAKLAMLCEIAAQLAELNEILRREGPDGIHVVMREY